MALSDRTPTPGFTVLWFCRALIWIVFWQLLLAGSAEKGFEFKSGSGGEEDRVHPRRG